MSHGPTHSSAAAHDSTAVADRDSRHAAVALACTLPTDVLLYLLLPLYVQAFGVSLAEAGVLLAANRLVRIAGYGWVVRFYAARGDRPTCVWAVLVTVLCAMGHALLSGFWALLPVRLLWGLCFAALNLSTQVLATATPSGAAARSGRSRAFIALGPVLCLPLGAWVSTWAGPRWFFAALMALALAGLPAALALPAQPHPQMQARRSGPRRPNALDIWSFLEGFTLDGLFVLGLSVLGEQLLPGGAVVAAGLVLAARYGAEIGLSPLGGYLAESWGAERLLIGLSLLTCVALIGFGGGWLWSCASAIVVLRALQLPLLAPIVVRRHPGADRVRALAARSVWRDIGASLGPITAGLLLPVVPALWLYALAAAALGFSALACAWSFGRSDTAQGG
ncbi:MAG: MFS transporter [Curvibacter sp.]|nr:MFS transporter [Curvibacter sp.]